MGRLVPPSAPQIRSIYAESAALWGGGLSAEELEGVWNDVLATPWGGRHASYRVWTDSRGNVLSSLKIYRPLIRVGSRVVRGAVLAAIFTPRRLRRRGHASAMLRHVLDGLEAAGDPPVLLFSDIGSAFYERFGFRALPALEQWGPIPREPAARRALELRLMREDDLTSIREAHDAFLTDQPLAVVRDEAHWDFLFARARFFFARSARTDIRQTCSVVESGGRFVGYVIAVEGNREWSVREVGARGGETTAIADVLRRAAVAARAAGLRRFYAWLPQPVVAELGDWGMRSRLRRRMLPMVRPGVVAGGSAPGVPAWAPFLDYQDQF